MDILKILFCPKLNQNFLNHLHLPPKQAGFGHQYLKTVLWLASWIKGLSLSREPKIFNVKDDAKTKGKIFPYLHGQLPAACLITLTPFHRSVLSHAALGSGLGWMGWVGSGVFCSFWGGFFGLLKNLSWKLFFCTVCLTMPLTRHLRY